MIKINLAKADLKNGDCLEVLRTMPENSVDSIVTDPPYGISFMGKRWDYDVPSKEVFSEMLRVLKPGGHALIACGTRTQHRMAVNIEDAGFEIRDVISWLYATGFPKSQDVVKSGQKQGIFCECKKREDNKLCSLRKGEIQAYGLAQADKDSDLLPPMQRDSSRSGMGDSWAQGSASEKDIHQNARAQKSGMERRSDLQEKQRELHRPEICSMPDGVSGNGEKRRLCDGTSSNHGEALESNSNENGSGSSQGSQYPQQSHKQPRAISEQSSSQTCGSCGKASGPIGWGTALKPACEFWTLARKPLSEKTVASNVLKHGTGGINIDGCRIEGQKRSPEFKNPESKGQFGSSDNSNLVEWDSSQGRWPANLILDEEAATIMGEPSRFFYVAKASKSERNAGCDNLETKILARSCSANAGNEHEGSGYNQIHEMKNNHPTVKPIKLMTYLCRLITPPGGIVLDPFMGSGSTGVAAVKEGFGFVGIEREPAYFEICKARIEAAE